MARSRHGIGGDVVTAKYPLAVAAQRICGGEACTLRDPERWVRERLLDPNYPEFRAQKIGRDWYMTDSDIQRAERSLYFKSVAQQPIQDTEVASLSLIDGLSQRGRHRVGGHAS